MRARRAAVENSVDGAARALRARELLLGGLAASDRADATAFYPRLFDWQADELAADQTGTYSLLRRGFGPGGRDPRSYRRDRAVWQPRSRLGTTLVNDPGTWC